MRCEHSTLRQKNFRTWQEQLYSTAAPGKIRKLTGIVTMNRERGAATLRAGCPRIRGTHAQNQHALNKLHLFETKTRDLRQEGQWE